MHLTKGQIINKLNKTNDFITMEPKGPVQTLTAEMSILLVLRALAESQGLNPGENCEITDYTVSADAVTLKYQKGDYAKESVVPSRVANFFAGDSAPVGDHDFED